MKKIFFLLCGFIAFSQNIWAQTDCPAGQSNVTVVLYKDQYCSSDVSTIVFTVNGTQVAGVPAAPSTIPNAPAGTDNFVVYTTGCIANGSSVNITLNDGFGDGFLAGVSSKNYWVYVDNELVTDGNFSSTSAIAYNVASLSDNPLPHSSCATATGGAITTLANGSPSPTTTADYTAGMVTTGTEYFPGVVYTQCARFTMPTGVSSVDIFGTGVKTIRPSGGATSPTAGISFTVYDASCTSVASGLSSGATVSSLTPGATYTLCRSSTLPNAELPNAYSTMSELYLAVRLGAASTCPTVSFSKEGAVDNFVNTGTNINGNVYCQSDPAIGLISDNIPLIANYPPNESNDQPGYFLRITGDSFSDTEQSMTVSQPGATPPISFNYPIGDFITGTNDFMGWYFKAGSPVTFTICDAFGDGVLPYTLYDLNSTLVSSGNLDFGPLPAGGCLTLNITPAGSAVYSGTGVTNHNDGTGVFTPSSVPSPNPLTGTSVPITYTWDNASGCTGSEIQTVTVWPTVTSTQVSAGTCAIPAATSQDAANYTATYTVSYTTGSGATSGTGFSFTPPASSSGNVTFTVTNPNAPAALATGCKTTTVVVPFNCVALCTTPTGSPSITNSTCTSGCTPSGGIIAVGTLTCSSGSLEYSTDGGTTWGALPTYNQTSSVSFIARCNCGATQSSATSAFTTTPGTCTTPSAPTGTLAIVNSTCSGCVVSGGSIAIGTVTGSGGTLEYSTNAGTTWSSSLPSYAPPQTIIASVLAANGCRSATTSVGSTVAGTCTPVVATAGDNDPACGGTLNLTSTPAGAASYSWSGPGGYTAAVQNPTRIGVDASMDGAYNVTVTGTNGCTGSATTTVNTITCGTNPILSVTDPCNCANGLDLNADGVKEYAQEVITIQPGTPPYSITAITGLFSSAGVALTPATATALITGPVGGNYTITAYVPANGVSTYSLTVQDSALPTPLSATVSGGPCAPCCAASTNMQWNP